MKVADLPLVDEHSVDIAAPAEEVWAALRETMDALEEFGGEGDLIRAVDYNIKPGIGSDEGDGDEWPGLRALLVKADILLLGSPIWLGQQSSVCKRVLERMNAFLGEKDDRGRMPSYSKVALAVVTGNEDGAHHVAAELQQALTEVGFTIPAGGVTYWVGEAMHTIDYKDLEAGPKVVTEWTKMLASNAAHLAGLLKDANYPGRKS
jgi:multimeric flavodoxin WrbA